MTTRIRTNSLITPLWAAFLLLATLTFSLLDPSDAFAIRNPTLSFEPVLLLLVSQQQCSTTTCITTRRCLSTALMMSSNTDKSNSIRKNGREKNFKRLTASNDMMTNHRHRLETAGKVGTQRYADPTLVFIGNLNFTTTEDQLKNLALHLVPSSWDIAKVKIVRDWKTGNSKGYGFVRFTEPVYATLCLHELNNKEFLGRRLKVTAANSRTDSPLRKQQREEKMRLKELRRAQNPPPPPPPAKPENAEFLAFLDKDLIVPSLDNGDDDDDDFEYDGDEVPGSPPPKGFG